MSAMYIPSNAVSYQAYSTDIVNGKVENASYKGASIYIVDEQKWYRILDDLTLAPLVYNIAGGTSGSAGSIFITGSVVLGAGEEVIGVTVGKLSSGSVEFTNTSGSSVAYSIGDTVSAGSAVITPYEIPNIFRVNGGSGYITGIYLSTNKAGINPAFRVHFYSASTVTLSGDNMPYIDSYTDTPYNLGTFDLGNMTSGSDTSGSCSRSSNTTIMRQPVIAQPNSKSLWVALETLAAFTPDGTSEKYNIKIIMDNN